jgi:predicted Zn finger-like uncharacterized protein
MSLITKCPACTTMFKVVPDQLRVSDGWVRCGQCSEVFDANLNLQAHTEDGAVPISQTPPPVESVTVIAADAYQGNDPFLAVNPHALHFEPEAISDQPVAPLLNTDGSPEHAIAPPKTPVDDGELVGESAIEHSFLQPEKTYSVWRRRSVRVVLAALGLVLGVMLTLQVAIHERDRIATALPDTKLALNTLCRIAGCTVTPLRQIESVVIDSSTFTKFRADVYRLSFTLKNTAHIIVATPSLELTLTDIQDQPVIRRVFTAMEFGDKSGVMEAGAELSVTMPLNVKLSGNYEMVSGYRLLSFYP